MKAMVNKSISLIFLFLALLGLSCPFFSHTQTMKAKNSVEMDETLILAEAGFTKIIRPGESIFIDYKRSSITRFDQLTGRCRWFSFAGTGEEWQVVAERSAIFSEIESLPGDFQSAADGQTRSLIFGPKAMLLRTVTTPVLKLFDLPFIPGRVDFLVDPEHPDGMQLAELAAFNRAYYHNQPMLRQIDPIGLVELLSGVPVQFERGGKVTVLKYQVAAAGTLSRDLRGKCPDIGR